jgi:predicted transcriptional regulator
MSNDMKIQSLQSLRKEMMAVARGTQAAPADAGIRSFDSLETVVRLLTKENRKLLSLIRDAEPQSVAELALLSGRSQPNLTRTLNKLEAVGFVRLNIHGKKKAPQVVVETLRFELNPYLEGDAVRLMPNPTR